MRDLATPRRGFLLPRGLKAAYRRWQIKKYRDYYFLVGAWQGTTWKGVPVKESPEDLIVLAQIIHDTKPEVIVETGTLYGGSAHFFSDLGPDVITVDIDHSPIIDAVRQNPKVTLVTGDSQAPETHARVRELVAGRRAMLFIDAQHTYESVMAELAGLADLVPVGGYAVLADTIVGGPLRAAREFVATNPEWEVDRGREYQLLTFFPEGYIRRRAAAASSSAPLDGP
jgi:cephalosporin hydroxylase